MGVRKADIVLHPTCSVTIILRPPKDDGHISAMWVERDLGGVGFERGSY